ncbi:glycosyltransferase [Actinomadura sp. HBU206391]|uniref:glycosyltransferase n=1 Tax=Actinomadura sp. HBU206391 TaxID=2731692 RepID=UPI00164EEAE8|nr:glycosyltransferase [Actinomadura sp. HBU206391]MBC6458771.1 glycosyltransferase [Actinomadura sp. HBU206391]
MSEPSIRRRQVRIRHNDYTGLDVPEIGAWRPDRTASVVIPAYGDQAKLDLVMAALAAQTYPAHLLQVVVVDDGSSPPLRLPELAPEHSQIVRSSPDGWGSAHAVHQGIIAADGDVVLRLDADVLAYGEHVEAHMRWHHIVDYLVVLGRLRYVDFAPGELDHRQVHDAVSAGTAEALFDADRSRATWAAQVIEETGGLLKAGNRAYRAASGGTISFTPRLYRECGEMNTRLVLGGDLELSYRLAQAGAVFVPDGQARCWHLGVTQMKSRNREGTRYREPFLTHYVPLRRDWRSEAGRQWRVPYIDVVIDTRGASYEDVRASAAGVLAGTLSDVGVTLVGPWSELTDDRRTPLDDPLLDLRLIHEAFVHDGRVSLAEEVPPTSAPAPFRFVCPAGLTPTADALRRLAEFADEEGLGLLLLAFPLGGELFIARLERTEAVARALALREPGEDVVEVVHELFGTHWLDGSEWALVSTAKAAKAAKAAKPAPKAAAQKPKDEAARWKKEAARLEKEAARLEKEAERWKKEAARLKRKVQAPLSEKLLEAAGRRVTRHRSTDDPAGRA